MSPTPDVGVRPARPDDAAAVAGLQRLLWEQVYAPLFPPRAGAAALAGLAASDPVQVWREAAALREVGHHLLVATAAGAVVGYAVAGPGADDPAVSEIGTLAVSPDRRGEGHGSRLLAALADVLRGGGATACRHLALRRRRRHAGLPHRGRLGPGRGDPRAGDRPGGRAAAAAAHRPARGAAVTCTGFPTRTLTFYEDLEDDNSKAFWTEHKAEFAAVVQAPFEALRDALAPEFGPAKIFRPLPGRAVLGRQDALQDPPGDGRRARATAARARSTPTSPRPGCWSPGGYYATASDQVARYRAAVDSPAAASRLEGVLDTLRAAGWTVGGDTLKTSPRGYDADHPRIALLRHRTLTASQEPGRVPWLHTSELVRPARRAVAGARAAERLAGRARRCLDRSAPRTRRALTPVPPAAIMSARAGRMSAMRPVLLPLLTVPVLLLAGCAAASDPSTVEAPTGAVSTPTGSASVAPSAGPSPSSSVVQIEVTVAGGKVVGGITSVDVPLGSTFRLVVTSDVADEVHLHGYDVKTDVAAGGTATIEQKATIPGTVEAELEGASLTLVKISSS